MVKKRDQSIEIAISPTVHLEIMTPETSRAIYRVLKKYFTKVQVTVIQEKADLERLAKRHPDLVFSGIKYLGFSPSALARGARNKIWFVDYLDSRGIRYTGSSAKAIRLEFEKSLAKSIIQRHRIRTAPFFVANPGQYSKPQSLPVPFPLFIKPLYEGGGKGIGPDSIVTDFNQFKQKVHSIFQTFKTPSLVERYLTGREFTIGVLDTARGGRIFVPVEQIAEVDDQGNKILSYKAKKADRERLIFVQNRKERALLSSLAKKAFAALGARGYGRIDVRMDERGVPHFLEANLVPGLNPHKSYFIKTCKRNRKMSYEQAIISIVNAALT